MATPFTTQFVCSTSVTLLSSSLVVRVDARRVIATGYALVAAGVLALGLAPVFPITFGALTRDVAPARPRLVGPLYACTGVGSALLPWLVGAGSAMTGSLRVGLLVPVIGTLGLLALSLRRLARPR